VNLWLTVNGKTFQNGSTNKMVFGPAFLVHYLSQFMSLQPGDIISTGTPPGVGLGQKPPRYLEVGDVIELGIEGMGRQHQTVVAAT
jgi:2-keto-4-pentenoate hydratase/2-oxohepta-3-ene-1,7-dioic acid hydratase in catechol pathway